MPQISIHIELAQESHDNQMRLICDEELGDGYYQALVDAKNYSVESIWLVALDESEQVVGFCLGSIHTQGTLQHKWKLNSAASETADYDGYFQTLAVKSSLQGKGIGVRLMDCLFKNLEKYNIETVYTTAWKNEVAFNSKALLGKYSFNFKKEIPEYWFEESLRYQYHCPVCQTPCKCTALIYEVRM